MNTANKPIIEGIIAKWQAGVNRAWDGSGEQPPITFVRFLDGCDYNFLDGNCIKVTPYEWFSAPDGRDWCVPFAQAFSSQGGAEDISLTGEEEAFVLNNFAAFAEYFAPPATLPDTYVDERRSYCESCDTYKKGVQWWTVSFQTRKHPLFENADGTTEGRWVHSACKSCVKYAPECQRAMKPAW